MHSPDGTCPWWQHTPGRKCCRQTPPAPPLPTAAAGQPPHQSARAKQAQQLATLMTAGESAYMRPAHPCVECTEPPFAHIRATIAEQHQLFVHATPSHLCAHRRQQGHCLGILLSLDGPEDVCKARAAQRLLPAQQQTIGSWGGQPAGRHCAPSAAAAWDAVSKGCAVSFAGSSFAPCQLHPLTPCKPTANPIPAHLRRQSSRELVTGPTRSSPTAAATAAAATPRASNSSTVAR